MNDIELLSFLLRVQTRFPKLDWYNVSTVEVIQTAIILSDSDVIYIGICPSTFHGKKETVAEVLYRNEECQQEIKSWRGEEEYVLECLSEWLNNMVETLLEII